MESKRKVVYHGDEHSHKKGKNIWGVSVTVKNNTAKRIVIASDGLLGKVERPDVISVNVPGALIGDFNTRNQKHYASEFLCISYTFWGKLQYNP